MAATFQSLYTAALRASQSSVADDEAVLVAKAGINEAYQTICGDGTPWDFLEREGQWTTASGADTYTYASILSALSITGSTIREVIYLVDDTNGGRPIASMSWGQLEGLAGSTYQQGESGNGGPPEAWAKWDSRLRLYPEPDGEYAIGAMLRLSPEAMTEDSDTVLLPDSFAARVLVPYAAAIVLEAEGGNDALTGANRLMQRHEIAARAMMVAHGSAKMPTFNVVAPSSFVDLDSPTVDY